MRNLTISLIFFSCFVFIGINSSEASFGFFGSDDQYPDDSGLSAQPYFAITFPTYFDYSQEEDLGEVERTEKGNLRLNNILFADIDLAYTTLEGIEEVNAEPGEYALVDAVLFSLNHTLDGMKEENARAIPDNIIIMDRNEAEEFAKALVKVTNYLAESYEGIKGCKGAKCFTTFEDWVEDADEVWQRILPAYRFEGWKGVITELENL